MFQTKLNSFSVTAPPLLPVLPVALVLLAEDSAVVTAVVMAVTLALLLATSAVVLTTLPVTARLRP